MALTCKQSLSGLNVGDYVWCKYVATSGVVGVLSDIATKTDSDVSSMLIPVVGTATPSGYFKYVCVGFDTQDRAICIPDRNLQTSISWYTINTKGIASGLNVKIDSITSNNFTMKLMSGGTSATDTNNMWDKILVGSTLGGKISAGDNNIWNWNTQYSLSSTTNVENSMWRSGRGYASGVTGIGGVNISNASSGLGFRPILLIEQLQVIKYLIQNENNQFCTIKPDQYKDGKFQPLLITIPTKLDYETYGFDDLNLLIQAMTVGVETFRPIDKFDKTKPLELYKCIEK